MCGMWTKGKRSKEAVMNRKKKDVRWAQGKKEKRKNVQRSGVLRMCVVHVLRMRSELMCCVWCACVVTEKVGAMREWAAMATWIEADTWCACVPQNLRVTIKGVYGDTGSAASLTNNILHLPKKHPCSGEEAYGDRKCRHLCPTIILHQPVTKTYI